MRIRLRGNTTRKLQINAISMLNIDHIFIKLFVAQMLASEREKVLVLGIKI